MSSHAGAQVGIGLYCKIIQIYGIKVELSWLGIVDRVEGPCCQLIMQGDEDIDHEILQIRSYMESVNM